MIVQAEQITFSYPSGEAVLRGASLRLEPGVVTGLFGPNGSGKSTLLRCLNGSLTPQEGRVLLDGRPVAAMSRREIARYVAVVPQDTTADVPLRVRDVVALGRYAHRNAWDDESADDAAIVAACLERLGIASLADRPFDRLSGGERQRAVIARSLAQQGQVLLLDEPNSHLDLAHQIEVYRLTRSLAAEGQAVLMICHDLLVAPLMVDAAVVLAGGQVVAAGPPREVFDEKLIEQVFAAEVAISWDDARRVTARF